MSSATTEQNKTTEPSVRELVTSAAADVSTLISSQVELAKAEMKQSASQAASAFALLIAAGVTIFLGVVFLLVTIAYVLVELGLPVWAGFGIVTLALILLALLMALLGKKRAEKIKGPERTVDQIEQTSKVLAQGANRVIAGKDASAS